MKTNTFSSYLDILQSSQSKPCVSIVIPTNRAISEREHNRIMIEQTIKKVMEKLHSGTTVFDARDIVKKIYECYAEIDFKQLMDGVGIFVSPEISQLVIFPLPVKEKIIIGDTFEIRDLVYTINRMPKYWALNLNMHKSSLFYGFGDTLTEMKDENFPISFKDQYQRQQNSKPYDIDKSSEVQTRMLQYFRKIDRLLDNYTHSKPFLLVLAGVDQSLGYFNKITRHKQAVIHEIHGHYDKKNMNELSGQAWQAIESYNANKRVKVLNEMQESIGKNMCALGIKDVMEAAKEGKGKMLIVEKNYMSPYITNGTNNSATKKAKKISDVVDDTVDMVLQKGGEVTFIENDDLKPYNRIAMILRYAS